MRFWKLGSIATAIVLMASLAYAQFSPPPPNININGHTYTAAQWQANPLGTLAGIANDVAAVTNLYPQGRFSPRVSLVANLDMYVSPSGSDSNTCLTGNPCRNVQKPFDLLRDGYDLAGHTVTVHMVNGAYSPGLALKNKMVGQSSPDNLILEGNVGSPSSVTITDGTVPTSAFDSGNGTPIFVGWGGAITVRGFALPASGLRSMWAHIGGTIQFSSVTFGATNLCHIVVSSSGTIRAVGDYTINGGAADASGGHVCSYNGGVIYLFDPANPQIVVHVTLSGTPTFNTGFAQASGLSEIFAGSSNVIFSGSATGPRYLSSQNSLISTSSSGASYFPGNTSGSVASGGLYQ